MSRVSTKDLCGEAAFDAFNDHINDIERSKQVSWVQLGEIYIDDDEDKAEVTFDDLNNLRSVFVPKPAKKQIRKITHLFEEIGYEDSDDDNEDGNEEPKVFKFFNTKGSMQFISIINNELRDASTSLKKCEKIDSILATNKLDNNNNKHSKSDASSLSEKKLSDYVLEMMDEQEKYFNHLFAITVASKNEPIWYSDTEATIDVKRAMMKLFKLWQSYFNQDICDYIGLSDKDKLNIIDHLIEFENELQEWNYDFSQNCKFLYNHQKLLKMKLATMKSTNNANNNTMRNPYTMHQTNQNNNNNNNIISAEEEEEEEEEEDDDISSMNVSVSASSSDGTNTSRSDASDTSNESNESNESSESSESKDNNNDDYSEPPPCKKRRLN